MKKLQNNFTTPEQSKRLLELGVPDDSADCFYDIYNGRINVIHTTDASWRETDKAFMYYQSYIPCWSVGRLIEIYTIASDVDFIEFDVYANSTCVLKELLERFENNIDKLDFSKLED